MIDYLLPLLTVTVYFSVWFLASESKKRTDFVDIAWGGGFIVIYLTGLLLNIGSFEVVNAIIGLSVIIWGSRLTYHIGKRNFSKNTEDPRYTEIKRKWSGNLRLNTFLRIFMLQAALSWLISLPIMASWNVTVAGTIGIFIGFIVWTIGFYFEVVADKQLREFKSNSKNKGQILTTGLWKYSRHPNYFGEITQWWGIWLMSTYINPLIWPIISPLLITYLILKVSGIPPLEKRYEENKEYEKYKQKTSKLIPHFPKN